MTHIHASDISVLLRGEPESLQSWTANVDTRRLAFCLAVIVVGAGLYGAAMGWWRDPQQGLYVAIKFPLIILLTSLGNAALNSMLAPLLGVNLSPRQCFMAILMSFTIASAILGSFSPLAAFMIWNAPPIQADGAKGSAAYATIQLAHVAVIAFAGIAANLRLGSLLRQMSGQPKAARRVLVAWLAGNLFLGSQLSWILRPFIGAPGLPVEFLRQTAFKGNFYESVFRSFISLWN
jgi:hypothetical protein